MGPGTIGTEQYRLQDLGLLEPTNKDWKTSERHRELLEKWAKKRPSPPPIAGL
jgi:hypothetical protein